MKTRNRIGALVVALMLAAALPATVGAQDGDEANIREQNSRPDTTQSDWDDIEVDPLELHEQRSAGGDTQVIVTLDVDWTPEGELTEDEAADQRRKIVEAREALAARIGSKAIVATYETLRYVAVRVPQDQLRELENTEGVVGVVPDLLIRPDLVEATDVVDAPEVWATGNKGAGQTVVVIDTGVDKTHPALAGRIVAEACFAQGANSNPAVGDCPNGADSQIGVGAGVNCVFATDFDDCDHGTHVAGIVAADGGTFFGVAPESNIIAMRVFSYFSPFDCGGGTQGCMLSYQSDQLKAIEQTYLLSSTHTIAALNMSLGGGLYSTTCNSVNPAYFDAIQQVREAEIAPIISAGNSGSTTSTGFPACLSNAIDVAASNDADMPAGFTNIAAHTEFFAPGVNIVSTVPGGGTESYNGTSMAAPMVAGTYALYRAAHPEATIDAITDALRNTGPPIADVVFTKPRIDIDNALTAWCPAITPHPFTDLSAAYDIPVSWLSYHGITGGTSPTTFSPNGQLTRGQMALFLWRTMDRRVGFEPHSFTDVPPAYEDAVRFLKYEDITAGVSPTLYGLNQPVTRGQMALFLWRMVGRPSGYPAHGFSDVPAAYDDAVRWLKAEGITSGVSPTTFGTSQTLIRGQMALFLHRLANNYDAWTNRAERPGSMVCS